MVGELHNQREGVEPILVQEAVSVLPERVYADLPTEDELGVEDDQPVESTEHRDQSDLMRHLLNRDLGDGQDVEVVGHLLGVDEGWRRLYDREGNLVPTDGEAREAAEAEVARRRQELARGRGDD